MTSHRMIVTVVLGCVVGMGGCGQTHEDPACIFVGCDDGNPCTEGVCDPTDGSADGDGCVYSTAEDGTACGDEAGTCRQGICAPALP